MSTKYKTNKLHSWNILIQKELWLLHIWPWTNYDNVTGQKLFPPALILFVNPGIQNTRIENEIETIYGENIIIIIGSGPVLIDLLPKINVIEHHKKR